MINLTESISLRAATADDSAFLLELFASTRIDEFRFLNGDKSQIESLIKMQFSLQSQQYHNGYPRAEDQIILRAGQPVGRILVDDNDREITLIDIAVLPDHRNTGIGRELIAGLTRRAAATGKDVRLHVLKTNRAQRLYERLGFRKVSEDGMYFEMVALPGSHDLQRNLNQTKV